MKIKQVVTTSLFEMTLDRNDLDSLKICLFETYHHSNGKIPDRLKAPTSHLMDIIDDAISKDDEIIRKIGMK